MIAGTDTMVLYQHRLELISRLLNNGYRVVIAAPYGNEVARITSYGCEFVEIPMVDRGMNPMEGLKLVNHLVRILHKYKPQVVLTFYTKTNIYCGLACQLAGIPYITNITGLGSTMTSTGMKQKFTQFLYKQAVRKASMLFFQNQSNRDYFYGHKLWKGKSQLLPGSGVALVRHGLLPYPPEKPVRFVFISRLLKEKGVNEYLAASQIVRKHYPDTEFHVVGPGDDVYVNVMKDWDAQGKIVYHGKVSDVNAILSQTHCTVLPSYYGEGMANVLLESAASGRPVITTSYPGCIETVDDGVTGFIVADRNVEDLVAKMERIVTMSNKKREAMGKAGRLKMEREFDRNIVVDAYINAINSISGGK